MPAGGGSQLSIRSKIAEATPTRGSEAVATYVVPRGGVVLALVGRKAVVFGGQGRIEAPGLLGGEIRGPAQHGVASLGRPAVAAGDA